MRTIKIVSAIACLFAIAMIRLVWVWFHGYFDEGDFQVKQAQWSSSKRLAVVAVRPSNAALTGYQYFVLIGNQIFSKTDLRDAYHSDEVVFRADINCLTVRWRSSYNLVVTCRKGSIEASHIVVEKHQVGDIAVSYENIPNILRR